MIALGEIYLNIHQMVPLMPFLSGIGVLLLGLLFYLCLVIMLGVLFESRGPVIGIAFGLMFGGAMLVNFIPQITYVFPVAMDKVAQMIAIGMPIPAMFISQTISAAVMSIVFLLVALWRFQHKEF